KIRFPLADAPAFANSQSFMNWGNCEATGRSGAGTLGGVRAYRCRVNGQTLILDESAPENYSYPWRDNFCETRNFRHSPARIERPFRARGDIRARTSQTLGGCDEYISEFLWPVDHHVVAAGHADELPAPIIL